MKQKKRLEMRRFFLFVETQLFPFTFDDNVGALVGYSSLGDVDQVVETIIIGGNYIVVGV